MVVVEVNCDIPISLKFPQRTCGCIWRFKKKKRGIRCGQNGGNKFLQTAPRNLDCDSTVYLVVSFVAQLWEICRVGFLQCVWQDVRPQYTRRWWSVVWVSVEDSVTPNLATSSTRAPESPASVLVVVVVIAPGHPKPTKWPPMLPSGGGGGSRRQRRATLSHRLRDSPIYTWSRVLFLLTTSMLSLAAVFLVPRGVTGLWEAPKTQPTNGQEEVGLSGLWHS